MTRMLKWCHAVWEGDHDIFYICSMINSPVKLLVMRKTQAWETLILVWLGYQQWVITCCFILSLLQKEMMTNRKELFLSMSGNKSCSLFRSAATPEIRRWKCRPVKDLESSAWQRGCTGGGFKFDLRWGGKRTLRLCVQGSLFREWHHKSHYGVCCRIDPSVALIMKIQRWLLAESNFVPQELQKFIAAEEKKKNLVQGLWIDSKDLIS